MSAVTNCLLLVDETIGNVLTALRAQSVPYTAVYTGLRPSHVRDKMLDEAIIQSHCMLYDLYSLILFIWNNFL